MILRTASVQCDICEDATELPFGDDAYGARLMAKARGWQVRPNSGSSRNDADVCPDCKQGPILPTPGYVETRVGREVRVVRKSGRPDAIGRLAFFRVDKNRVSQLGLVKYGSTRTRYIPFEDVAELRVSG